MYGGLTLADVSPAWRKWWRQAFPVLTFAVLLLALMYPAIAFGPAPGL